MTKAANFGTSLAFGMCCGTVFGLLIDDLALGVALGPLFGIVMNSLRPHKDAQQAQGD